MRLSNLVSAIYLAAAVRAHPGEVSANHEAPTHSGAPARDAKDTVARCSARLSASGHTAAAVARRAELARTLRAARGLAQRDFASVLGTDHHSNKTHLGPWAPPQDIFTGELQCVLQPEASEGPYYVRGELIRSDAREDQEGVPLFLDYQVIDTSTCAPAADIYLDVWHANATGVYAGIVAPGNGDINDLANINATFARALVKTDRAGVACVQTIFPGHYTNRTTHIHLVATAGAAVRANGTLAGGHVAHVGQVFFDQALIGAVERVHPYTTNAQPVTTNAGDDIMAAMARAGADPVMRYVWLGARAADGVLAWLTVGINASAAYDPYPAVYWTAQGGVDNPAPGGPPPPPGWPTSSTEASAAASASSAGGSRATVAV